MKLRCSKCGKEIKVVTCPSCRAVSKVDLSIREKQEKILNDTLACMDQIRLGKATEQSFRSDELEIVVRVAASKPAAV